MTGTIERKSEIPANEGENRGKFVKLDWPCGIFPFVGHVESFNAGPCLGTGKTGACLGPRAGRGLRKTRACNGPQENSCWKGLGIIILRKGLQKMHYTALHFLHKLG